MKNTTTKEKVGDYWRTPIEVFNLLNKEFNFVADMASSKDNKLCRVHYTEQNSSLDFEWAAEVQNQIGNTDNKECAYVWCNPPYSNPMPWVQKAIRAQEDGLGTVMLLNSDTSVGWFAEALTKVSEIHYITAEKKSNGKYASGRISFIGPDGVSIKGNNKPQLVFVFNPLEVGERETYYIPRTALYGE